MDTIWKAALLIAAAVTLLRIAGRKSISQMTLAQTVLMISIGVIITQPIVETSIVKTLIAAGTFIAVLMIMELLQVKMNPLEKLITGKAKTVIENGQLQVDTLRKLRITVDQLEMRLRQQGIQNISDVKVATIEPNGQLGYKLMEDAQPLTVGDFKNMMSSFMTQSGTQSANKKEDIFAETVYGSIDKNNPNQLQ